MSQPQNLDQFNTLVNIIARLRGPDGCPWDREQTHLSLRENLLEECYEVLEALDAEDAEMLSGELGDLLLQVVLHAQIAAEASDFEVGDVLRKINTKLIHRHPHIFGSRKVKDAAEVTHNWELLKQEERAPGVSMLAGIPRQMPALAFSQRVQGRVARVGFDWADVSGIIDKLTEEVGELREAASQEEKAAEFGDLLFTLANIARREGVDLESALRQANERFSRRFTCMEELCRERGLSFAKLTFAQQNGLWEEAKKKAAE
ncbi:MAG: nucleoside triphosphate pyrophosphohydrolase [Dehalococcoidales bacterium]|nr:nucleoside triphosphate pyrophosphohydrolase [Dehalococcoidales bacterium]